MGLFSTLLNASNVDSEVNATSGKKASSELPTVIQLFCRYPIAIAAVDTAALALDLDKKKRKTSVNSRHSLFAPLHYFAVQCHSDDPAVTDAMVAGSWRSNNSSSPHGVTAMEASKWTPDLGIWNCRADGSTVSDALLPMATRASSLPLFCLVVDMSLPWGTVEPHITTIQQALVRYLIQHSKDEASPDVASPDVASQSTSGSVATTSQYLLQTVQFGLADQDPRRAEATNEDAEATKRAMIALCICVVQPTSAEATGADDDYQTQQQRQLLMYHLRKYASALNATLMFCQAGKSNSSSTATAESETETGASPGRLETQPTVTMWELPIVWRALASGIPVWKYDSVEAIQAGRAPPETLLVTETPDDQPVEGSDDTAVAATDSGYSLLYGPGNHNPELIETVLLRNASLPGQWDARTDSVWKILAAPAPAASAAPSQPVTSTGDHEWLSELRESVAPNDALQTPAKGKESTTTTTAKTPNDEAVSSFFEDLLK